MLPSPLWLSQCSSSARAFATAWGFVDCGVRFAATAASGVTKALVAEWVRERTANRDAEPADLYQQLLDTVEPAILD